MPPKVSKTWKRTSETFLKDVEKLFIRSGSICLGVAVVDTEIRVVASPNLRQVLFTESGAAFIRSTFGNPLLSVPPRLRIYPPAFLELTSDPNTTHRDRVATLVDTTDKLNSHPLHQGEQWLLFAINTANPEVTVIRRSSNPGIFNNVLWGQLFEDVSATSAPQDHNHAEADASRTRSNVGATTSGRQLEQRAPHSQQQQRRVRRVTPDERWLERPVPQGPAELYAVRAAHDQSLYITPVAERVWALPDYDVDKDLVKKSPVQVSWLQGESIRCTCYHFGITHLHHHNGKCVHTCYVERNRPTMPAGPCHQHVAVVPICSRRHANAANVRHSVDTATQTICFWTGSNRGGNFVFKIGSQLRCNKSSHRGRVCPCVTEVGAYLQRTGGWSQQPTLAATAASNTNRDTFHPVDMPIDVREAPDDSHIHEDVVRECESIRGTEPDAANPLEETAETLFGLDRTARFKYPPHQPLLNVMHRSHLDDCAARKHCRPMVLSPAIDREQRCNCGQLYMEGSLLHMGSCTVHQPEPVHSYRASVYAWDCPRNQPGCQLQFGEEDALKLGLFKYSTETIMAIRILYQYIDEFIEDGRTLEAFVRAQKKRSEYNASVLHQQHNVQPFCSSTTFRRIYYRFAARLHREYGFRCVVCKDQPDVLIGDATAESIQKRYYNGTPITTVHAAHSADLMARPHARCDRSALGLLPGDPLVSPQKLVMRFAEYIRGDGNAVDDNSSRLVPYVAIADFPALRQVGLNIGAARLFQCIHDAIDQGRLSAIQRKDMARFVAALASDSPVISYLPLDVALKLDVLLQLGPAERIMSPEVLDSIAGGGFDRPGAPLIFPVLEIAQHLEGVRQEQRFPRMMTGLMCHLIRKSKHCASGSPINEVVNVMAAARPSCSSTDCLRAGVCAGVPQVRGRRSYQLDDVGAASARRHRSVDPGCRHAFTAGSHGSHRTGGIFTWFCKHGICYGFYMLPDAEGRNEAFSFLTTHFKEAPKVIVYDFACALHDYCLNREPHFFKHTRFLVDRFHWFNHRSCARSYNLSLYDDLGELNSQVAEQCNSSLRRIKATVSQMCQEAFMFNVRLYLDVRNEKKNRQLLAHLAHNALL